MKKTEHNGIVKHTHTPKCHPLKFQMLYHNLLRKTWSSLILCRWLQFCLQKSWQNFEAFDLITWSKTAKLIWATRVWPKELNWKSITEHWHGLYALIINNNCCKRNRNHRHRTFGVVQYFPSKQQRLFAPYQCSICWNSHIALRFTLLKNPFVMRHLYFNLNQAKLLAFPAVSLSKMIWRIKILTKILLLK